MEENNKNKDYESVLLERLEGKIDAMAEGQSILSVKVDLLVDKVDLLAEDMDYVKSEIVEIKDRFRETDETLAKKAEKETVSSQETRLAKLENVALTKA